MNTKRIITITLAVFLVSAVSYLIYSETRSVKNKHKVEQTKNSNTNENIKLDTIKKGRVITAYYFHTTFRCTSCTTIESYTREAISQYFAKELKEGRLKVAAVNVEEPGNKHFIEKYKLHTKSVVLVDITDGNEKRSKTLDHTWRLLGDKDKFFDYIKQEVHKYLEGIDG